MTSKLLFTFLLLSTFPCFLFSVHAQTPTASDSGSVLRDSVKQKVAEELAAIKQAVSKKGFVGSITDKGDASVTLTTLRNQVRHILVTNDSVIKLTSGKDGTVADLKSGDLILAMGDVDSQNQMTAKRLLVITKPATDNRQVAFGTITAVTSSTFTLQTKSNATLTIKYTSATKLNAKLKSSDISTGDTAAIIYTSSGSTLTATRIYLDQVVASPTPKPTTKPSATPKLSPTP